MSVVLIYGRRRVGKSELVKQMIRQSDIKSIYYECKQVAEASNVIGLSDIVSDVLELPKLGYNGIESLLDFIFKISEKEKITLVLDEYPYLRESVKGLDSILQALIDKYRDHLLDIWNICYFGGCCNRHGPMDIQTGRKSFQKT